MGCAGPASRALSFSTDVGVGDHRDIRAWRQSLLWLVRSLYLLRMAVCYFVMVRGRHARPDLLFVSFTTLLFTNTGLFLAVFFEYEPTGRRAARFDSWLRPAVLAALLGAAFLWTANPGASLGWARGPWPPILLALEFVLAPLVTLALLRAIAHR